MLTGVVLFQSQPTSAAAPPVAPPSAPSAAGGAGKFAHQEVFARLCEMGDEPERRLWLEGLFSFMDDKGTPISVVPAISKNALDLYRLYHLTKEKGGLVEVRRRRRRC